jgi:hypothetical protein
VEFEFDEDQLLLRQSVRETLAKTSALPEDELWATYAALGWLEARRSSWPSCSMSPLEERGQDGLVHPARTAPPNHMGHDTFATSWFERYARTFPGTIAGGTSEVHRNIIAERILGLPR